MNIFHSPKSLALPICAFLILIACSKAKQEAGGYRVMGYNSPTHEYTLHRDGIFDGKYLVKKYVVKCISYKSGRHPKVDADDNYDACQLPVGDLFPSDVSYFIGTEDEKNSDGYVGELNNETLTVITGRKSKDPDDQVVQRFKIMSITVLPDKDGR